MLVLLSLCGPVNPPAIPQVEHHNYTCNSVAQTVATQSVIAAPPVLRVSASQWLLEAKRKRARTPTPGEYLGVRGIDLSTSLHLFDRESFVGMICFEGLVTSLWFYLECVALSNVMCQTGPGPNAY
jgi:hypothetical protein